MAGSAAAGGGLIITTLVLAMLLLGDVQAETWDALDEVNALRLARGLPAYEYDEDLAQAALACALTRAEYLCPGHTQNDFAALPAGSWAQAAGCAAWPVGYGWGSCCSYERYRYAGAAAVIGRDRRRYMHIFVR